VSIWSFVQAGARGSAARARERTGVDEVRMVVSAFVQTEKLGTSLADTLRVHADAARIQRRHRAEKAAYLAPLKMLFPIVGFLFPSIFVVTVAPALLKIMYALRGSSLGTRTGGLMRRFVVPTVTMAAVILFLLGSALAQESSATIRTFAALRTRLPTLRWRCSTPFGDPKEKDEGDSQGFKSMSMINVSANRGRAQRRPGWRERVKALARAFSTRRGHCVESGRGDERAMDRIQSLSFARKPVAVAAYRRTYLTIATRCLSY